MPAPARAVANGCAGTARPARPGRALDGARARRRDLGRPGLTGRRLGVVTPGTGPQGRARLNDETDRPVGRIGTARTDASACGGEVSDETRQAHHQGAGSARSIRRHRRGVRGRPGRTRAPLKALLDQAEGIVRPILSKVGADPAVSTRPSTTALAAAPEGLAAPRAQMGVGPRLNTVLSDAFKLAEKLKDAYVSSEHLLVALASDKGEAGRALERAGATTAAADRRGRGAEARLESHRPEPRGAVPGARALRAQPHAGRARRQARPGHRPRRRDPPHDPGPLAPHEEQPGAHRRAGDGEDGDRRGARAAHRRRATCPSTLARQGRRHARPRLRWSRARSTAASSRTA